MAERPIIFSAPMVRAVLDGRKTQTRRLLYSKRKIKNGMIPVSASILRDHPPPIGKLSAAGFPTALAVDEYWTLTGWHKTVASDSLWVRESLRHITSDPVSAEPCSVHCYAASILPGMDSANPYEPNYLFATDGEPNLPPRNIPSIHMPRWASRITLKVTAARTERLQDISEADVLAEGITERDGTPLAEVVAGWHEPYAALWDQLHGPGSWNANPQVVVISFELVRP